MKQLVALAAVLALGACSGGGLKIATVNQPPLRDGLPSLRVADAALAGGMPQTALNITRGLLAADPGNVPALLKQAETLALMGQADAAAECYTRVLAKAPHEEAALLGLGRIQLATGQAPAAEALFRRALAAAPANATAENDLGIALDMQDRHADAQEAYRSALRVEPGQAAPQVNLGLSMALSGNANGALAILRPLAADPSAAPKVRHDLAAALSIAGDTASAAHILQQDMPTDQVKAAMAGYEQAGEVHQAGILP